MRSKKSVRGGRFLSIAFGLTIALGIMGPAVILGGLLEHRLMALFGAPLAASLFLICNGVLLLFGERLRASATGQGRRALATLTATDALVVGLFQCLALLPGLSRSGATIVGGLLRGVDHAGAAHFSFLIAAPIILGARAIANLFQEFASKKLTPKRHH